MTAEKTTRVLCIAGSPRRGGNSDKLLEAFIAGVEQGGATAVRLVPSAAGIAPCRGCNACTKDGRCIQHDGMDDVYALLNSADAIVIASPTYFAGVPASLKALYDRCQPFWARRYVMGEPPPVRKRPGALLVVGGGGDPFGSDCVATITRSVFAVLGVELSETIQVIGPDKPDDILRRPAELQQATELGGLIASKTRSRPRD